MPDDHAEICGLSNIRRMILIQAGQPYIRLMAVRELTSVPARVAGLDRGQIGVDY